MIEFRINYWELGPYHQDATAQVVFDKNVEIVFTAVHGTSRQEWDKIRQLVTSHGPDEWPNAYGGTTIREEVSREDLSTESVMAFGALHHLTPDSAGVAALEKNPAGIVPYYAQKVFKDSLGNRLGVIGPITPAEKAAADELMQVGLLQALTVTVTGPGPAKVEHVMYFAPYNLPGVATSELSDAAIQLRKRVP